MAHNESHELVNTGAQEVNHEPLPLKVYIGVFVALLFLTFVTVWVAHFDWGRWDVLVAMAIALLKASLVALYFMNLKHDSDKINRLVFLLGIFFLIVFIGPTMWDTFTRDKVDPTRGMPAPLESPIPQQGSPAEQPGSGQQGSPIQN